MRGNKLSTGEELQRSGPSHPTLIQAFPLLPETKGILSMCAAELPERQEEKPLMRENT